MISCIHHTWMLEGSIAEKQWICLCRWWFLQCHNWGPKGASGLLGSGLKKRAPGLHCIGSRLQGTRIDVSVWAPRKEEPWSLGFKAKSPGLQWFLHFGTLNDVYALYLHLLLIGFIRKKLAHVMYADQSEWRCCLLAICNHVTNTNNTWFTGLFPTPFTGYMILVLALIGFYTV